MKKQLFKILFIIFLLFLIIWWVFAAQKYLTLNANSTLYPGRYKVTNNENYKIFVPYTNISGKILWNSTQNTYTTYWNVNKLTNSYTAWWFTIQDAWYTWRESGFWTCSNTCWWWTKYQTVACKNTDGFTAINESYCTLTKPSVSSSCNTQACTVSVCNSTNIWKQNSSWQTCKSVNVTNETHCLNSKSDGVEYSQYYYYNDETLRCLWWNIEMKSGYRRISQDYVWFKKIYFFN